MSTLKELEARIEALERRKEPEVMCLRKKIDGNKAIYEVAPHDIGGWEAYTEKYFPVSTLLKALARKVGLKIVYTHPSGERVDFE